MAFKDPAFVVAYGPSKYGKTTDLLYSFPNAFFLAAPGALKPAEFVVGFSIPDDNIADPKTIPEATKLIPQIAKKVRVDKQGKTVRKHNEIGVDDFSLLAERSASELEKKNLTGFKFWGALRDEIIDFRDECRRCGVHVVMNCHEIGPKIVNGMSQRGGPKLPGKLPEELPAACDLVVRATIQTNAGAGAALGIGAPEKAGWKGLYRCSPSDVGYISGDRHGVTPDYSPMNLGEILRAAGFPIARAPGLEWMETAVSTIAQVFLAAPKPEKDIFTEAARWLLSEMQAQPMYQAPEAIRVGLLGLHIRWVLRDAYDRAVITRARMNPLSIFGI